MTQVSPGPDTSLLAFGPFCLSPAERLLSHKGAAVDIGGRALDLLIALLERPGQVVAKKDLMDRVWPDLTVEDGSLRFHMTKLRAILGDGEEGARYISTQVGVGYAFVAPVERQTPAMPHLPVPAALTQPGIGNLPPRMELIGRSADVERVVEQLETPRLLTVVGPAGIGKTSLATEIGHRMTGDGEYPTRFVDLAQVEHGSLVPSVISSALGLQVQADDPMIVLLAHLRARSIFLIIDNCEHLIDAVCAAVERIRAEAPLVVILATSREPLRALDEHVHWLSPLSFPATGQGLSMDQLLDYPAVRLFMRRATAGNTSLVFRDDDASLIGDICRRLEGVALSIELTAIRVASHGVRSTDTLLGDQTSLGWSGRRTALPRQKSLLATFDWSYELLTATEQCVFERLSVFIGPFGMEAAAFVVGIDGVDGFTAVRTLDELAAKGLVTLDHSDGHNTYRLHEMTRAYAKERLKTRTGDNPDPFARRHASYYLELLNALGPDPQAIFAGAERLFNQLGNIRSALDWSFGADGDLEIGLPLAAAAAPVFLSHSLMVECRTWCTRAVDSLGGGFVDTGVEMELQAALGIALMFTRGNTEAAGASLARALAVAVRLDEKWQQLRLLGRLHIFHERIGDFATAYAWAQRAAEIARDLGAPEAVAVAASLTGISHHLHGDQDKARADLETSLRNSPPYDPGLTVHYGFDHRNRSAIALARTLWLQGLADQALQWAARTEREAARLAHPVTHCIALLWNLSVYLWTGEIGKAWTSLEIFEKCAADNALKPYIAASIGLRGTLAMLDGGDDNGIARIEDSLTQLHGMRYELLTTSFEISLAESLMADGRHGEALTLVVGTIDRCLANGEGFALPELFRLKAALLHSTRPDEPAAVEETLHEGLRLSRVQGALGWGVRLAIDLAGVLARQGRQAEAAETLRSVRDAVTEGRDTHDIGALERAWKALQGFAT